MEIIEGFCCRQLRGFPLSGVYDWSRSIATYFWSGCLDVVTGHAAAASAFAQLGPPKAFITDPTGTHGTAPVFPDGTSEAFLDRFVAGDTSAATRRAVPRLGRRSVLRLRPRRRHRAACRDSELCGARSPVDPVRAVVHGLKDHLSAAWSRGTIAAVAGRLHLAWGASGQVVGNVGTDQSTTLGNRDEDETQLSVWRAHPR